MYVAFFPAFAYFKICAVPFAGTCNWYSPEMVVHEWYVIRGSTSSKNYSCGIFGAPYSFCRQITYGFPELTNDDKLTAPFVV